MSGNKRMNMMNKTYIHFVLILCMAFFSGCVNVDEFEEPEQKVTKIFYADMENQPGTKTVLGEKDAEGLRTIFWVPEDSIGVAPINTSTDKFDCFVNKKTELSNRAVFEGITEDAQEYAAIYPYHWETSIWDNTVYLTLDPVQTYVEGSFDQDAFPMLARTSDTDEGFLKFLNLCGILEINLKGEEKIESITFSSDNNVSGLFSVDLDYELYPALQAAGSNTHTVKLDCGDGVQLDTSSPTSFYLVLPPADYQSFSLLIRTVDGKLMLKQSTKPLTITRSRLTAAGALAYVESESIDLSLRGTSTCYVVPSMGMYKFNATVIGNGEDGLDDNKNFHTDVAIIAPTSAELVWAYPETVVCNVSFDSESGNILFLASGIEGNALIAAKDEDGTILWSWHIWATDQPKEQRYINDKGEFDVLDRNLGATRADRGIGDEWKESCGLYYQWGRKDPFLEGFFYQNNHLNKISILEAIQNPNYIVRTNAIETQRYKREWMEPENRWLWIPGQKSIYDPCPVGYVVANKSIWNHLSVESVVSEQADNGWLLKCNDSEISWYPNTGRTHPREGTTFTDLETCYLWSSEHGYNLEITAQIQIQSYKQYSIVGLPVRCMKDGNYVNPLSAVSKVEEISDITGTSATIKCDITFVGKGEITSRGIVYGTSPRFNVDTANKIEATDEALEFTIELSGLETAKKYFVRAYAVNGDGISYSDEVSFHTLYVGEGVDLSKDGTANCYIVPPVYSAYTFDYTVKGNSLEPVGEVASVEVLWETKNTVEVIEKGDIISSVGLLDDRVRFVLPSDPVPGNALIAVKDASDNILWSWHIWVVDFDPFASSQIYPSGAMMMDRNLGALVSDINDVRSFGFFYQWGRKDPFVGSGDGIKYGEFAYITGEINNVAKDDNTNTLSYSILHPDTFITKSDWNENKIYWNSSKTEYDPCPNGWRVADKYVWEELNSFVSYPKTGILHNNCELYGVTSLKYIWSCTFVTKSTVGHYGGTSSIYDGYAVRCMKDADFVSETVGVSDVTEEGATLTGKLTINDNTVIEEMGFVLSTADGYITIIDDTCIKLVVSNTTGTYSVVATGLYPNTIYYVRAYAKGGYNDKYGEIMEFRTHSVGISDDFTDDGYEWE